MIPSMTSEALRVFGTDETLARSCNATSSSTPQLPVIQWFTQKTENRHDVKGKMPESRTSLDNSAPPSPTTPTSMLRDALNTDLHDSASWNLGSRNVAIQRPPQARLNPSRPHIPHLPPSSHRHPRHHSTASNHANSQGASSSILHNNHNLVFRAPPILSSISRATLPTSSLSLTRPPLSHRYSNSAYSSSSQLCTLRSPPSRSITQSTVNRDASVISIDSEIDYELYERQGRGTSGSSFTVTSPGPVIEQSPPPHTSLDTLRDLYERSLRAFPSASRPSTATSSTNALPSEDALPISQMKASPSPTRWWYRSSHKDSVDNLLDESDRADTIETEDAQIRKKYLTPRHPLVFCHGLLGFDSVQLGLPLAASSSSPTLIGVTVSHWRGIREVLEANGAEVLITRVPATSSPVDRAKVLEKLVEEKYPGRAVHLIGHSMGGLDCRYLTSQLHDHTFRVLSVTTVGTPHRGSAFASHFLDTIGEEAMPRVLALLDWLPNGGGDGKAFESLTIESMKEFNELTEDVDGVKYFSWGAKIEPGLLDTFRWPHSVILEKEGPNDGLVSVESAKWGTYLGTLEDVNHLDLVGWINTARYKWAEITGRKIKFKPATFYLGVADFLAKSVEGQGGISEESQGSSTPHTERKQAKLIEDQAVGDGNGINADTKQSETRDKVGVLDQLERN